MDFTKTNSDNIKEMYIIQEIKGITFKYKDLVTKHKSFVVNLRQKTSEIHVKDGCNAIIDFLEGRSLDSLKDELAAQQEDIDNLDVRVTSNEKNITIVTKEVTKQRVDITNIKQDVKGQGKKLDKLGNVVKATVTKVEEIDLKTLSHAPYWSKDVSKLLNPKSEHDWRLLSSRLGYSKDDIRAWSQQSDPCMAMLNEWYTTHKTSEANYGLLTALQEMSRMDAAIIIENGMKASEPVVEDEEFDYITPPSIFLSYQWGHQEEVKLLRNHLEMAGYSCWMDIGQMGGGDKLFEKIDKGIRVAKIIISCTTEKYAQSPNCNREVNLSVNLKKPIIPLLLESCPWPPKGSMGPIFSEYLYIQFYQTENDEAAPDDRFWPIPKFQELLMQLSMNGVQPDESRVFKLYRNWWKPLVDELKIDKSKTFEGGKHRKVVESSEKREDTKSPAVFISYQWDKQKNVMKLYKKLTELGYHCWMDIYQMGGGDSLYDKIDRGIRGCKVVVSCVTDKYSLSLNCRREISLCDSLKRPIIPLLLENIPWPPKGPMSMTFTQLLYIDLHSNDNVQEEWSGTKFDELQSKLREILPDQTSKTNEKQKSKDISESEEIVKGTKSTHLEKPKPPPITGETNKSHENQTKMHLSTNSSNVKSATPGSKFGDTPKVKRFVPPPPPIQSDVEHEKSTPVPGQPSSDTQVPHTHPPPKNFNEQYHQAHNFSNQENNNDSVKSKSCVIL
ncbi:hypothetical protein LOTGIDRAFT_102305 [Lottia gigantea]|uniref:Uncharacterized protein n=1 Tax=Lottia gigantea TaxID=225164 RepID=V4BH47_LOTGI|nr:hypothetical protein LOTGIDRAFT_102305 [Lottia gigantea]ESP05272.1 hypothetical protein LOTGIDRAFT_102305 [Lottia gigantea]